MSSSVSLASNDDDAGPRLIAVAWTLSSIALILVALRFYTRARVTRSTWWDDWVILATLIPALVASGIFTAYARLGGGHHLDYLDHTVSPSRMSLIIELSWVGQVFTVSAICIGKVSVALLIYRIQAPNKWRTRFLIFSSVTSIMVTIVLITLFFAQCTPAKALWEPSAGHCWSSDVITTYGIFAGSWAALMDMCLALLPITIIWPLHLSLKKRTILAFLLGLGVFASISGAVKTSYVPKLTRNADVTWITVSLLIWNACEANVIIIAACLPTIRPLFVKVVEGVKKVKSLASSQNSGYQRHSDSSKKPLELHNMSNTTTLEDKDEVVKTMPGDEVSSSEEGQEYGHGMRAGCIRKTIRMEVERGCRNEGGYE